MNDIVIPPGARGKALEIIGLVMAGAQSLLGSRAMAGYVITSLREFEAQLHHTHDMPAEADRAQRMIEHSLQAQLGYHPDPTRVALWVSSDGYLMIIVLEGEESLDPSLCA